MGSIHNVNSAVVFRYGLGHENRSVTHIVWIRLPIWISLGVSSINLSLIILTRPMASFMKDGKYKKESLTQVTNTIILGVMLPFNPWALPYFLKGRIFIDGRTLVIVAWEDYYTVQPTQISGQSVIVDLITILMIPELVYHSLHNIT